jgi:hypothetical protein
MRQELAELFARQRAVVVRIHPIEDVIGAGA